MLAGGFGCRRSQPPELAWQPDGGWTTEAAVRPRCVYFKELQAFLPTSLSGFQRVRDEGSTGKYGDVSVSEAERAFTQPGNREIAVRIVDSTALGKLADGVKAAAAEASRQQRPELATPISLPQALGYVRFEPSDEKAEVNLLVADRFVVSVTSRGFQSTGEVRRIAEELDLAGLSKLR